MSGQVPDAPLRILHLIPNVRSGGGAQAVLFRLAMADSVNRHDVVTLLEKGAFAKALESGGVSVRSLDIAGVPGLIRSLFVLRRILRQERPDVLQSWMYHADLLGAVASASAGVPVVWGLHHTTFEKGGTSRSVRLAARLCAWLSPRLPQRIVSCSEAGVAAHIDKGYAASKLVVVSNGYDTRAFTPRTPGAPDPLRAELGLAPDTRLLGMAARWDPQKDHANLIAGLARLARQRSHGWHVVLFGSRMEAANEPLVRLIDQASLADRITLLGRREDVIEVMRSLDVHVLSSRFGEAFPNVLNESMLVGTPCVTTDVGDAARIVGDIGWTVPPSDPDALGQAMLAAVQAMNDAPAWATRCAEGRRRIVDHFSVETMLAGYDAVWRNARLSPARSRG